MEEGLEKEIVAHSEAENNKVDEKGVSKKETKIEDDYSLDDITITEESFNSDPPEEDKDVDKDDFFSYKVNQNDFNIASSDRVELEGSLDDYRGYLGTGDSLYMPVGGQEAMNITRAQNQGSFEQFRNFLGQSVVGEILGGTIEGFGYLLDIGSIIDVMKGNETDWGNFMTDIGQGIREKTEENLRIYQDPSAQGWGKMADSGWWFGNGVSVFSTFSMMLPTIAAARGLSTVGRIIGASKRLSRGMKAVRKAAGLASESSVQAKWMREGISQAVLSRNIENWMEAHGTFESYKQEKLNQINPKTKEKFTEEEATKLASEAAAQNWKQGWAMLLQDMTQYLAIGKVFNPITRKMETSRMFASSKGKTPKQKYKTKKVKNKDGTFTEKKVPVNNSGVMPTFKEISGQSIGELFEEGYQYVISQNAALQTDLETGLITQEEYDKKFKDLFGDEEMMTSMFFGGLGGAMFSATGPIIKDALKSKSKKDYEKNIGKNYAKYLSNSAKQISLLNQYKAEADKSQNPDAINHVIDESMMSLVANSLERDQYDQFEETLEGIMNMSKEDVTEMNKDNEGGEFDQEMAKEYIPELLKKARSMKSDYFKLRNKGYSPRLSKAIASKNIKTKIFQNSKERNNKKANELIEGLGEAWLNVSDRSQQKQKLKSEKKVNNIRKKELSKKLKELESDGKEKNSVKIKNVKERLDVLEKKGKILYSKTIENNKSIAEDQKNETESEKEQRKLNEYILRKSFGGEKRYEYEAYLYNRDIAEDGILENQIFVDEITSPEGMERVKKKEVSDELSKYEGKELSVLEDALKSVKGNNFMDEFQKKEFQEGLSKMIKNEKSRIREENKKQSEEADKKSMDQKDSDSSSPESLDTPEVSGNDSPIDDSIEDELSDEMLDKSKAMDDDDNAVQKKIKEGNTITLLNPKENADAWSDFVKNPKIKKVGTKIIYSVAPPYEGITNESSQALSEFEEAKESGGKVSKNVYDKLNIQATVLDENGAETKIHTRIPTKSSKGHYNNYADQRAIIIDKLLRGEDVITEIAYTEGGELNLERNFGENNTIPENIIIDLEGYSDITKLNLLVTNKDGKLVKASNKKEIYEGLSGTTISVGDKHYRGGVFLVVNRADGTEFPLRLNLKKNSRKEAELLAKLVTAITLKTGYSKGKVLSLVDSETTISEMKRSDNPDIKSLYSEIMDTAPKEVALLNREGSSGTVGDLISLFVHYTSDYENRKGTITELMWGKNGVHFGGQAIGEPSRFIDSSNSEKMMGLLIDFFENTKRRQFNLKKWNTMPGYKEYVINEGIINTDAKTKEPLFIDNGKSRAQDKKDGREQKKIRAHVAKIKSGSSAKIDLLEKYSNKEIPQELIDRMNKTESSEAHDSTYPYFYKKGQEPEMESWRKKQKTSINYESKEAAFRQYEKELKELPDKIVKKTVTPSGGAKAQQRGVKKTGNNIGANAWKEFVDTGKISDTYLNIIADKIISGTDLNKKETAILSDKTSEIEEIIKEKAQQRGVVKPVSQNNKNDIQKIDLEKRKQQELERIVKDLEQKESVLREKDGSVSKENMKAWQQIRKKIAEAKEKTKRADTSEGKGLVAIKNKPKSEKENPKIISGDKAVVAEGIIEKIISTGIEQGLSSDDILQKILKRYSFASNHLDLLRNHISDRNSNAPEIGNNKQSFPSWRKGKYDSEQSTSNQTQQPAQQASSDTSFNVENGTQGSLQKDGYMAFNDNSDHSQDSVRIENGWAMVADGVSSNKNSKEFADALLKELAKDPVLEVEVVKNIIEDISKKHKDAAATLALTKKNPDGSFSYFTLGDSQVIVVDKNGKAKKTFAQIDKNGKIDYGNTTHAAVAGVGIAGDFQTGKIKLNAGEKLVIASDGIIDVFQYRDGTTKEITDFYNKVTSVFDTNLLAQISEASFEELSSIVKGDKQAKSKVAMSILLGLEKAGLLYDTMANNPSLVNSLSLLAKGDDNSFIVLDNSFNGSKTQQTTQQTVQGKESYSYADFAKENKGKKIKVKYDKYKDSFDAVITGEVETVMTGSEDGKNVNYVSVQARTNTGKLVQVNPFNEIEGNVVGVEKLNNESNKIYEKQAVQGNRVSKEPKGVKEYRDPLKKKLEKGEYSSPNDRNTKIVFNSDGSYKMSGRYNDKGVFEKAEGNYEENIKSSFLKKAKKQNKEDRLAYEALTSPLVEEISAIIDEVGPEEFRKLVYTEKEKGDSWRLGSDVDIGEWIVTEMEEIEGIKKSVSKVTEKLKENKDKPKQTVQDIVKDDAEFDKKNKTKSIEDKIKILTSNPKGLEKVESNGNRYYQDKYGRRYVGISSIVNPSTFVDKDGKYTASTKIGTAVDETLRDFFAGKDVSYEDYASESMKREVYEELIETAQKFKNKYSGKNVEFLTEGLFLSDYSIKANKDNIEKSVKSKDLRKIEYGIATELDMVVVDKDTGSVDLVDFKTVRTRPGAEIFDTAYSEKKINGYSKQQNASRLLIEKNTGIKFNSMSLMPIRVYYPDYGKTTDVAKVSYNLIPLKKESVKEVFPKHYADQFNNKEKDVEIIDTPGKEEEVIGGNDAQIVSNQSKLTGLRNIASNEGNRRRKKSSPSQANKINKYNDNSDGPIKMDCLDI